MADPLNYDVITLSAQAEREVQQDLISITFFTAQTGPTSAGVQEQLVLFTNEALAIARAKKKGSQVRVDTGGMTVSPAYDKKGSISGYAGRSTIVVSGTDMETISALTGEIKGMAVESIDFSVSPSTAKRVLKKLTLEAIEAFQEKAIDVAAAFGAQTYKLVNANVNSGTGHRGRATRGALMASSASMPMGGALEVEGGKEQLTASVSGSIQLSR